MAVVTGAASGIGRALADRCAAEGMKVVLADIEQAPLDAAVAELRAMVARAIGVHTDVSRAKDVEALAQAFAGRRRPPARMDADRRAVGVGRADAAAMRAHGAGVFVR